MSSSIDERILDLLRRRRQGLSLQNVFKELKVQRKERAKVEAGLKRLEGQGLIRLVKNRFLLPVQTDLIRGKFVTTGRGFGFVTPDGRAGEDIFIPGRFAKNAIQGDVVEVLFKEKGKKGKPEGKVVRILKKEKKKIIGLYTERFGQPYLVPFDTPVSAEIPLTSRGSFFPGPGTIVAADRSSLALVEVFGMPDDPGVDTKVIIQKYGLAVDFSKETLAEAEEVAGKPAALDKDQRLDYRGWTTLTIDGEKAQDFDDAVSIRKLDNGHFLLGVHIADVSHYVEPGAALDREAFERGTSVYFPDVTLPMLPEKLSNDVCSLRPRQDRLTFSVLLEIEESGRIQDAQFHPSMIRTAERLTYTTVFKVFEDDQAEKKKYAQIVPDLLLMRELAGRLRRNRVAEGSLDFDLLEPELIYKEGRLHSIATFAQNEAHKIIEEFMVAANVAVASFLSRRGIPSLYRIHPRPAVADLEKLRETLAHFNILLPKPEKIESRDLQRAIAAAEGRPEEKFVNVQVLRALRIALYFEENQGHYGLAKEEYTHFTSPIRRYPDLAVHRILKEAIRGKSLKGASLAGTALHSSEQERKADDAEKDLLEWRIYRFLKGKLGEEFTGIVVDIGKAGLIVELDDYFVHGLLAFADLGGDTYWKKSRGVLSGKRTGQTFELGQALRVILVAVDPVLRRMNFILNQ
ncbi:MAG: ribonuclease R [Candidatus Aminicenantes bacterium]|nr:ribonuclease R [Candidatus Aminicenantes bacterium]